MRRKSNWVPQFSLAAEAASRRFSTAQKQRLSHTEECQANKFALGGHSSGLAAITCAAVGGVLLSVKGKQDAVYHIVWGKRKAAVAIVQ